MSPWFKIDNEALERAHDIGSGPWMVFCVLARHADGNGLSWPSVDRISSLCGVHRSTVLRSLQTLESDGWIKVQRTPGQGNKYHIPPIDTGSTGATGRKSRPVALVQRGSSTSGTGTSSTSGTLRKTNRRRPTKKTKKKAKATPTKVQIPSSLDAPDFQVVWQDWLGYRRERKLTLTPRTLNAQLRKLDEWGPATAAESIKASITNGWAGLFEPKGNSNGRRDTRPGPGQRHPDDARADTF